MGVFLETGYCGKSNGIFKMQDSANVISVETGGRVVAVYMQEGIYVK